MNMQEMIDRVRQFFDSHPLVFTKEDEGEAIVRVGGKQSQVNVFYVPFGEKFDRYMHEFREQVCGYKTFNPKSVRCGGDPAVYCSQLMVALLLNQIERTCKSHPKYNLKSSDTLCFIVPGVGIVGNNFPDRMANNIICYGICPSLDVCIGRHPTLEEDFLCEKNGDDSATVSISSSYLEHNVASMSKCNVLLSEVFMYNLAMDTYEECALRYLSNRICTDSSDSQLGTTVHIGMRPITNTYELRGIQRYKDTCELNMLPNISYAWVMTSQCGATIQNNCSYSGFYIRHVYA